MTTEETTKQVREALAQLRWSISKGIKSVKVGPDLAAFLCEDGDSPSFLLIGLRSPTGEHFRVLPQEHVETKGKGKWFRSNCWRLADTGLDFWAANIADLLVKRAEKEQAKQAALPEQKPVPALPAGVPDEDAVVVRVKAKEVARFPNGKGWERLAALAVAEAADVPEGKRRRVTYTVQIGTGPVETCTVTVE